MRQSSTNRLELAWTRPASRLATGSDHRTWSDTAKKWEENLGAFITDHPRLSLATAVACGLFLGWIVKRK